MVPFLPRPTVVTDGLPDVGARESVAVQQEAPRPSRGRRAGPQRQGPSTAAGLGPAVRGGFTLNPHPAV